MSTIRLFRQYLPVPFVLLAGFETIVFIFSLYIGVMVGLQVTWQELADFIEPLVPEALFFSFVMLLSLAAVGLYQRRLKEGRAGMVARIVIGVGIGVLVINQLSYTIPDLDMGRNVWLWVVTLAFIGVMLARLLFFSAISSNILKRRILVLGAGDKAKSITESAPSFGNCAFKIVGYVPLADENLGVGANLILAAKNDLLRIAKQAKADEIVVAVDSKRQGFPTESLMKCKLDGIEVIDIVSFYEREAGKIKIDWISPSWFIFADGFGRGKWRKRLKRISDIVVSCVLLVLFMPIILITAAAILIEGKGKGPILYRQSRVGERGREFELLKFRSMCVNAEQDGKAQWAAQHDPRVTKVGKFIRRTRIDEIPQIFNVLKGEMSFVGPRPERGEIITNLEKQVPYYQERHAVKPGITGWAQVCYPYGATIEDAFEKLQYDLYYVKNNSLFLDFVVLLQTAEVVLWRKGSR